MDKAVLVTGANSGIGLATCVRLARDGWRVIGSTRSAEKAEALHAAGREAGVTLESVLLEVDDPDSIASAFDEVAILTKGEGLHAVVNNAGYTQFGAVEDVGWRDAAAQLATNVLGPIEVARAAMPAMRKRGDGRIVNVSSVGGRVSALPFNGWYHASKFALEAVSDVLRIEVGNAGIKVILIEPGVVRTGFVDEMQRRATPYVGTGSPHEAAYRRTLSVAGVADRVGIPPEWVAWVIAFALRTGSPLPRYLVGPDAWALVAMNAVVPTQVRDALIRLALR